MANAWEQAVHEIRSYYPTDIFPPDSKTVDAKSAAWARQICDNIIERARELEEEHAENGPPAVTIEGVAKVKDGRLIIESEPVKDDTLEGTEFAEIPEPIPYGNIVANDLAPTLPLGAKWENGIQVGKVRMRVERMEERESA